MANDDFIEFVEANDVDIEPTPAEVHDEEVEAHYNPPAPPPPADEPPPLAAVLAALEVDARPDPALACATCPAATWRRLRRAGAKGETVEALDCFCQYLHSFTYDDTQSLPFVLDCEGRLKALAEREDAPALEAGVDHEPSPNNKP